MKLLTLIPNARVAVVMQMVIGGTNINRERSGLSGSRCDLLIATPGRLQDHLDSTQGFVGRLWGVQVGWRFHFQYNYFTKIHSINNS
jgi:superfamily II DNA/RNA helicase